jgi:hypothetical protein
MAGNQPRKPVSAVAVAAVVLAAVAYASTRRPPEAPVSVPALAAGWHGAMEMYQALAVWAGKRALQAEAKYWEAVG